MAVKQKKEYKAYLDHFYDHEVYNKDTGQTEMKSNEVWGVEDPKTGKRFKSYQRKDGTRVPTTKLGNEYHAEIIMNGHRYDGLRNAGIPEEEIKAVKYRNASSLKGIQDACTKAGHPGDTVIVTRGSKHNATLTFPEEVFTGKVTCKPDDNGVFDYNNKYTYLDMKNGQKVPKGQRKPFAKRHYVRYKNKEVR